MKETPLANWHRAHGARMVDFAGWNMPVQYKSIINEHMSVRENVGLFDVSHMGEFIVNGEDAERFLQYIIANDLSKLSVPNCALYTQLVNETGGTVDDIIVYRRSEDFLVVVNASNIEKDWRWFNSHAKSFSSLKLSNQSNETALLALQGPKAISVMQTLVGQIANLKTFHYGEGTISGVTVSFGRTGYTGEDGFEIFVKNQNAELVWQALMGAGAEPCGLGARDTLRLESCLPLYGHELDDETSPLEAGLGWSVKLNKGEFVGQTPLQKLKETGLPKQLVCLVTEGKALPRQGYVVKYGEKSVGKVTSGSQGIFVKHPIAFAYVPPELAAVGTDLSVEIRGANVPAKVVQRPFYKAPKSTS